MLLCAATVYELVKIPSHLMQKKIKMFVANCAGGNNPDQCAASVTAARRGTRYHRGPSLSSAISRCICACHGCCWVTDTAPKLLQHISQHLHRVFFFPVSFPHTHVNTPIRLVVCVCGCDGDAACVVGDYCRVCAFKGALWSLVVNKQKLSFLEVRQTC